MLGKKGGAVQGLKGRGLGDTVVKGYQVRAYGVRERVRV